MRFSCLINVEISAASALSCLFQYIIGCALSISEYSCLPQPFVFLFQCALAAIVISAVMGLVRIMFLYFMWSLCSFTSLFRACTCNQNYDLVGTNIMPLQHMISFLLLSHSRFRISSIFHYILHIRGPNLIEQERIFQDERR